MRRMENSPSARARSFLAPVAATTRMTLPQRILLNVTLAAGIVIAVATYVTFRIVHLEAKLFCGSRRAPPRCETP